MRIAPISFNRHTAPKALPRFEAKFREVNDKGDVLVLSAGFDDNGLSMSERYEKYKTAYDNFYEMIQANDIYDNKKLMDDRLKPINEGFGCLIGYNSIRERILEELKDKDVEFSIWLYQDKESGARAIAEINSREVYEISEFDLDKPKKQDKMVAKVVKYVKKHY